MRRKKILYHSNWCKSKTGFGRHSKALLKYLYKTGKYEIIEYAAGVNHNNESLKNMPWTSRGTMPDTPQEWQKIMGGLNAQDQHIKQRSVSYGEYYIDEMIKKFKPDIYLGVEDIWAFNGYFDKPWWNKINCMIHTTLDSLPLLPEAVEAAEKIKNYYVWASFAEEEMKKIGKEHVKTLHGAIEASDFYRLSNEERRALRKENKIPPNAFVVGFVFRNQLRKSVVKLLQAFKLFLEKYPESNAHLLLHTHWSEPNGWNIPMRIREVGIDPNRVLTTFFCRNCKKYEIKPFKLPPEELLKPKINTSLGQNQDCRFCGAKKSQVTANIQEGVSESELNEIYNLMDVYVHAFTSGGQEIPIVEAKLTELITLVTNYSCGTDYCKEGVGTLPLAWQEYREPGSEFIKATTSENSIFKQLEKVFKMKAEKRKKMEKESRTFALDYDVEVIGKQFEEIFDKMPYVADTSILKKVQQQI